MMCRTSVCQALAVISWVLLIAPLTRAAVVVYDDLEQFKITTGALALPVFEPADNRRWTVSDPLIHAGMRFIPAWEPEGNGRDILLWDKVPELEGAEIYISVNEDLNVEIIDGMMTAFGYHLSERCGVGCYNPDLDVSEFTVTLKADQVEVGSYRFTQQDRIMFIGLSSEQPFNRVEIRETVGTTENDPMAYFLVSNITTGCVYDTDCPVLPNECLANLCRSGVCTPVARDQGTPCRGDGLECTLDECRDGQCEHLTRPMDGLPCGDPTDGDCDAADTCYGGVCLPNHAPVGTECGAGSDECGVSQCDGQGHCEASGGPPWPNDHQPPTMTVPSNVTVKADAGGCSAALDPGWPIVTDNCSAAADTTITFTRSDRRNELSDLYAAADSPITISWRASDESGNTSDPVSQTVVVRPVNDLTVALEYSPALSDPQPGVPGDTLTRCVSLDLWRCPSASGSLSIAREVAFAVDDDGSPHLGALSLEVPCGSYGCATAWDRLHTLHRTDADDFGVVDRRYVADFTSGGLSDNDALLGGNLNGDSWIDIMDYALLVVRYGQRYPGGDTDCSTASPHVDIDGDSLVSTADFTFLIVHFLSGSDAGCCGGRLRGLGPRARVSLAQLEAWGQGSLSAADLNGDGMLDVRDMEALLHGAKPPRSAPLRLDGWPRSKTWGSD